MFEMNNYRIGLFVPSEVWTFRLFSSDCLACEGFVVFYSSVWISFFVLFHSSLLRASLAFTVGVIMRFPEIRAMRMPKTRRKVLYFFIAKNFMDIFLRQELSCLVYLSIRLRKGSTDLSGRTPQTDY